MPKIKILSLDFHRNGVRNESFFLAKFQEGKDKPLFAVLTADSYERFEEDKIKVFDPEQPNAKFRGDYFAADLAKKVKEYYDIHQTEIHSRNRERE